MLLPKAARAACYIFAQALMKLYNLPADWEATDEHAELRGDEYLDGIADQAHVATVGHTADNPGVGADSPAEVFNSGADVAAAFGAHVAIEVVGADPVYTMLPAAGTFTREQYHAQGWTDQMLVDNGMMIVEYPKPPAAPAAPPAPPAPPTPPTASAPAAALAPAPATNPAPVQTGTAVELDADGLPWDARIHSGGKTKGSKTGLWARRKNLTDAYYNQIRAELMQRPTGAAAAPSAAPFAPLQAAPAPAAPLAAPAAPAPAVAPQPSAPPGNSAAQAAIAQAHAAAQAAHAAANPGIPQNFNQLCAWASPNNKGHLFAATAQHLGIPSFGLMAHQYNTPDMIAKAYNFMISQ